ncbi:hypothetical protein KL86DYS2_10073 [uncultured Dysgonomonas sp.]|uniref:Uncharacterized protein n=1 Tax=uncultured Dysgonomonas sp. TaxID=206096 RepID=A0A212IUE3_9BACT|nr:hypothetical protein KL86DYS2_10073 [uncultured Dysgonomonas sp.]
MIEYMIFSDLELINSDKIQIAAKNKPQTKKTATLSKKVKF